MVATKSLKITTRGSAGSINEREFLSSLPDIQTMLSYLDGSETLVKKKWLNQISDMLKLLVDKWTMNYDGLVDDLENMMIYLSDLTQDCLPARMQLFASNPQFLRSILILVNSWLSVEDKTSSNALNFHRCRHLGVFVLLGLINGKSLCETFLQTVDHFDLFSHFKIFPDLFLTAEIQFTTQEMILEIFCRIYLMYLRNDNSKALLLLQHFPLHQKNSFLRMGPKSILKNMRLYLNEINETNPNITSVALLNASCLFNHSPVKSQLGKTDYADFGMEFFSFYLEESSLISINYESLQNFYPTKANLQIKLSLDKDISELTKFIPPNTSTLCLVLELRSELEFNKVVAILEEKTYLVNGNGTLLFEDESYCCPGGCSQFQTLIDEELSPILRKREHTKITTTHHEDQPLMKMAEKTIPMTRPEVLKPAKRLKKTVEIPDLSSSLMLPQPPGENSLPLILEHLQTIYRKKSKKKQMKQRAKISAQICLELEEFTMQKWVPYILRKIDSGLSNNVKQFSSMKSDVNQFLHEVQKQLDEMELRHVEVTRTFNEINGLCDTSLKQIKKYSNGNQIQQELTSHSVQIMEGILVRARGAISGLGRKDDQNKSKKLNTLLYQSLKT